MVTLVQILCSMGLVCLVPHAAASAQEHALRFQITDESGEPIPCRLTFVNPDGSFPELFQDFHVAPKDLAIRGNTVASLSGKNSISVPAGEYDVYVSRGLEWSVAKVRVQVNGSDGPPLVAQLRHEVDTTGWVSGDFHLHTLTHSGHGDSEMLERIISIVGEGLEFAVATDHNHHTDYDPVIEELNAGARLRATVGNEVSVPIGHFNVFPLDPDRPVLDPEATDANELFRNARAEINSSGVVPIVQLNHPRWYSIDYFGLANLDPVTGGSASPNWSGDFDSLEVFNENSGWGYYDSDVNQDVVTGSSRHWVFGDWYNLLNRGYRCAAVGNSDSHTVAKTLAGYPRNYLRSSTDEPGQIDIVEVAQSIRNLQLFTTLGPFIEMRINDAEMGQTVVIEDGGAARLWLKVQAASWVDCDRIHVVVNGETRQTIAVPDTREVLRLETEIPLDLARDSWVVLLAEGDDSLHPVVHDQSRPILPLACTNPIWVDVSDSLDQQLLNRGQERLPWTSPWQRALRLVQLAGEARDVAVDVESISERVLTTLAAVKTERPFAATVARWALQSGKRELELAGARACEELQADGLLPFIGELFAMRREDDYLRLALLRAAKSCSADNFNAMAEDYLANSAFDRYGREVSELLSLLPVRDWKVLGYFPSPTPDALLRIEYGPETAEGAEEAFRGKNELPLEWKPARSDRRGWVELRGDASDEFANDAIAYAQTFLFSENEGSYLFAFGSDDGAQIYVNDELIHEDGSLHGASPMQTVQSMSLHQGWNRVVVKVSNATGDYGFYFNVLDSSLSWSDEAASK